MPESIKLTLSLILFLAVTSLGATLDKHDALMDKLAKVTPNQDTEAEQAFIKASKGEANGLGHVRLLSRP